VSIAEASIIRLLVGDLSRGAGVNVFEAEYPRLEVEAYGATPYKSGNVEVKVKSCIGRCDDYLNVQFRTDTTPFPLMYIDGELWMSLTPMEIQSHVVPLNYATGKVGCLGLGLGYFALRAAQKEDVEEVIVYEKEKATWEYFSERFHHLPCFSKIEVCIGDAREKCRGIEFDYLYSDIYQTMCPSEAISDIALFQNENSVNQYSFWGEEKLVHAAFFVYDMGIELSHVEKVYFQQWLDAEIDLGEGRVFKCSTLRCEEPPESLVEEYLEASGRY